MNYLGQVIKERRTAKDFTQKGLAASTGLKPSAVAGIERGKKDPTKEELEKIAEALGVRVVTLKSAATRRQKKEAAAA